MHSRLSCPVGDRKSTRLNSSHSQISYAVFCLKNKRTLIDSFPDLTNEVTSITSDDEGNVAVEVVISGTQAKPFGSIGNQGLHYDLRHVFLFRVGKEGLIEEITAYWDTADWQRQLGWLEVD